MLVPFSVSDHGSACVTLQPYGLLWPPYLQNPVKTPSDLPGPTV